MDKEIIIKEPTSKFKMALLQIADILAFIIFIFGLFMFIKLFVVALVKVDGHSMLPNYNEGDFILVDKFYRKLDGGIKRGDVVVVMPDSANNSYLKRVVGLPNETIELTGGKVYVCKKNWTSYTGGNFALNDTFKDDILKCIRLKEDYIDGKTVNVKGFPEKITTTALCNKSKFVLGKDQYLVFGDDRMYSTDSRCCFIGACIGKNAEYYITKDQILGRVWQFK